MGFNREIRAEFKDLGQVVTGGVVPAGAYVFSTIFQNTEWVRNVLALVQIDQAWGFYIFRAGNDGVFDWGTGFLNDTGSGTVNWATSLASAGNGVNSGILGAQAKFALQNRGSSPTTVASLKVQLFGL